MLKTYNLLFLLFFTFYATAQTVSGELKKWHKITIEFTDDATYTETGTPNPFLDRRLNVTFTHSGSGKGYIVPGYFATDGNAAETSATSGNKWHVHFAPDETGTWNYSASFREGFEVAATYPSSPTDGSASAGINGDSGSFVITNTDKSLPDNRARGRLVYDDTRYPKFSETGDYFIKAGLDSPENLLAFDDFDDVYVYAAPNRIKDYASHVSDWQSGDPQWQGTKGRGLIGAINYLASVGLNSVSFLTMNKETGDSKDVTMLVDQAGAPINSYLQYDVSRIAQWEIIFEHADTKGMFLHFKTQEQENAALLNSGSLGTERKLYYRELIARFGHHLALNWNMGEENEGSTSQAGLVNTSQRIAQLNYVKNIDPYQHLRVIHSGGADSDQNAMYDPLTGTQSELMGVSMQVLFQNNHNRVKYWVDRSANAGKAWVISSDENGTGGEDNQSNRENYLYGTYFAGGYGIEYYFQGEDQTLQNFKSGDKEGIWEKTKYALDFMNLIPFNQMEGDDSLISGSGNQCFYKNNDTYALYLSEGNDNPTLDINNTGSTYTIKWYDVRNGGALQNGTVNSLTSNGTAANIGLPPSSTASDWVALITNNAVASTPQLSINNVATTEGGDAIFNVNLTNAASGSFTVGFTTVDGTAISGSDYTVESGTLTFDGPPETKTITVTTTDDAVTEDSEQFTVSLSNATNGVEITDATGIGTINDNDPAAKLTVNDVTVTEGEDLIFTISLDNAVGSGFDVNYSSADNSATFGEDYTGGSGTLSFNGTAGEEQFITIPTIDDILVEGDEQFVVNLGTNTTSVSFEDDQGLATITDNDFTTNITINDITVDEGDDAVFSVTLDNTVSGGFTVDFSTQDDTALAGGDYIATNNTITFNGTAGETQSIPITTTDDNSFETDEQFFMNLSNATNDVTIADNQGIATITDNDDAPSLSIDNVTVEEGNNVIFTVTADTPLIGGFTVDFATQNNSATAGIDFTANSDVLTFTGTAGETQTITIVTTDDATIEANEQFFVNLSNATNGATIADSRGVATITDNDDVPSITIDDVTIEEGNNAIFTLTADKSIVGGFTVDFATQNNSALAGTDFTANNSTVTFAGTAGETQTITITTIEDASIEATERFFINLSNATNGVIITDSRGIATITDNDVAANITINNVTSTEGTNAVLTVTVDNPVNGGFTVDFATQDDSATAGTDFTANSNTVTFAGTAGETRTITIATTDDVVVEANERFFVNLNNASNGVTIANNQGVVTISDNDATASIAINNITIEEGNNAVFTLSLDNAVSGGFTVDFATQDNTATAGTDFTANGNTVMFAGTAGETQTITIATSDDAVVEANERFFINLSNATNGVTIADNQGIATITDNDDAPSLSIDNVTVEEGNNVIFTVTADTPLIGGFTVDFATQNNSATAGIDFTANSDVLTFTGTAGETQTITIVTTDDVTIEANEQFFVNLSNATNGATIADSRGVATITDNDDMPSITIDNVTIEEGNNAVFTVTADNPIAGGFTLDFATQNNSAIAGTDFTATNGTVIFTGTTSETQTITITTIDNTSIEATERFFVNLSNATNGVIITDSRGTATITDNDVAANITINNVTITEGTNAVLTVTVDKPVNGGFTVDFTTQDDSATAGTDFIANSSTVTFAGTAGETQTITIATTDDATAEANERFFVNLSNATNGVTIADNQGITTITDNDADASVSINDITIVEGNDAIFTLTLDGEVNGGFTLDFDTSDNTALSGADYTTASNTVTFDGTANETKTVSITTIDDTTIESNESFSINLSNATNGVSIADAQGVGTITDNDNPEAPSVNIEDATVNEGNELVFPVTISPQSSEEIALTFTFIDGTANELDYNTTPIQLVFMPGQTVSEIRVSTTQDTEIEMEETFTLIIDSVQQGTISNSDESAVGTIIDITDSSINELILYPSPLRPGEELTIANLQNGTLFLSIFSMSSKLLLNQVIEVTNNSFSFNSYDILSTGVYILNIENLSTGDSFRKRFMIRK